MSQKDNLKYFELNEMEIQHIKIQTAAKIYRKYITLNAIRNK